MINVNNLVLEGLNMTGQTYPPRIEQLQYRQGSDQLPALYYLDMWRITQTLLYDLHRYY